MSEDRVEVRVRVPADLDGHIEARLEYGDSKAGWVREAIRQRLQRERAADASEERLVE